MYNTATDTFTQIRPGGTRNTNDYFSTNNYGMQFAGACTVGTKTFFVPMAAGLIVYRDTAHGWSVIPCSNEPIGCTANGANPGPQNFYGDCAVVGTKLVFAPWKQNKVLTMDIAPLPSSPAQKTYTVTTATVDERFKGAVAVGTKVYLVPYNNPQVGVVDVSGTPSMSYIDVPDISGQTAARQNNRYEGGAAAGTKVYFAPSRRGNVGVVNTVDDTFSTIDVPGLTVSTGDRYSGAVLVGNKMFFIPMQASTMGYIEVESTPAPPSGGGDTPPPPPGGGDTPPPPPGGGDTPPPSPPAPTTKTYKQDITLSGGGYYICGVHVDTWEGARKSLAEKGYAKSLGALNDAMTDWNTGYVVNSTLVPGCSSSANCCTIAMTTTVPLASGAVPVLDTWVTNAATLTGEPASLCTNTALVKAQFAAVYSLAAPTSCAPIAAAAEVGGVAGDAADDDGGGSGVMLAAVGVFVLLLLAGVAFAFLNGYFGTSDDGLEKSGSAVVDGDGAIEIHVGSADGDDEDGDDDDDDDDDDDGAPPGGKKPTRKKKGKGGGGKGGAKKGKGGAKKGGPKKAPARMGEL